ncbi:MAG: TM2 domain-containing protein [Robiginitomaculum sp.]|nr:TM2 domain-containing protein [Robiginitomaculum sp.]
MQGKVLGYDDAKGSGVISGDDGNRYDFVRGDLKAGIRSIPNGTTVDFEVEGGVAKSIYSVATASGISGDKNKIVAALLAFFLGGLGVHKFYLGKTGAGIIMLLCGTIGWLLILPALINLLIAFIEFIIYLLKSDQEFHEQYVVGNKSWF